ncbi:DUF1918 domain-containing protein [Actinomycetospora termitidis]|uniref:DUF1918 domain-containing protein n=1 Tax=Actinomycetospora termitidis TaxID=3053470 RepID=A0ABT7MBB1_9PSEU|nr:DUF1918 domain-containing protein [Actinomycetospora sp. Odt1-22]MDL5157736.1 DUF1918 domain-containing protein [Actinomycetospora sp. Odt1-22]
MSADVGDRITLHANSVDAPDRTGTIVGILGSDGPPYRVRFDNGDETILTPGPDATIAAPTVSERVGQAAEAAGEKATALAEEARATAEDVTGRAARAVADTASKLAERFQK